MILLLVIILLEEREDEGDGDRVALRFRKIMAFGMIGLGVGCFCWERTLLESLVLVCCWQFRGTAYAHTVARQQGH